jgi:hypothetical protein
MLVRTANARNTAIEERPRTLWESTDFGLRTTDYGVLAVRRSWEVIYSLYIEGQERVQLRSVEHDQAEQSSHILRCF